MTAPRVRPAAGETDLGAVRALCREYRALLAGRAADCQEIVENYYAEATYEALLRALPDLHRRPDGAIFLAELDGSPVGCAMTQRIGPDTCEIKRVFVSAAARGRGVAVALFEAAMERARADGYGAMKLDTMIWLTEAVGLYARLGFAPCAPFYDPDPRFARFIRFFGRRL